MPSPPEAEAERSKPGDQPWPVFRSLRGYRRAFVGPDLVAGITLAAIAIPEQMATARLGALPPQFGFVAFIAASLAFLIFGASRRLSAGADSTITPIFAGALALLATAGSPHYAALAAGLGLLVGLLVGAAGALRMGWIANLLSIPVTLGFLAGIAVHIVLSQLPSALGLAPIAGEMRHRLIVIVAEAPHANLWAAAVAGGVLALIAVLERVSPRLPGALIAIVLATGAEAMLHLERRGVAVLGAVGADLPRFGLPALAADDWLRLLPLALLVALVVMVQTAATARSFAPAGEAADENRDFIGLGAANLLAGLAGAFPVNASPPRTAVVAQSGGRSQLSGLAAVVVVGALLAFGTGLLRLIPQAALAGVLLFVAVRLMRLAQMRRVLAASRGEALLIAATAAAIIVLPIERGVGVGVGLSLLHGLWGSARTRVHRMHLIPGTSIWWATTPAHPNGETAAGVAVLSFQAPLTFLNADAFLHEMLAAIGPGSSDVKLAILEGAGIVGIDFTAGEAVKSLVKTCRSGGVEFAVARLESVIAQADFVRLGLRHLVGADHVFDSVAQAIEALGPGKDLPPAIERG